MDPISVGIYGLVLMVVLLILGMRIAFVTAFVGFLGILYLKNWETAGSVVGFLIHPIVSSYTLSVVPLFIIMGHFGYHAGMTRDIFWATRQWFGNLPGGLAIATVFGCAGFAACTGSSTASAAVMGKVAIPEMLSAGYDRRLATGVVAAGGTLAIMIPPSVMMVIYGIITEQSVGKLLVAGIIPGILSAVNFAWMIYLRVKITPSLGKADVAVPFKNKIIALRKTWGLLVMIILVMGGIYTGVFTPTEAGGVGAFGALCMALVMRRLTWNGFKESLLETGVSTIMIFSIMVGVLIFIRFLALSGIVQEISRAITALEVSKYVILMGILVMYAFLGMVMDGIGMLMLTIPIVFPVITRLGFDPIWFGIVVIKMVEICLITPPVALNVFMVKSVAPQIPMEDIVKGIIPFFLIELLTVSLFVIFPEIVTYLPSKMKN